MPPDKRRGRQASAWWSDHRNCYLTRLGPRDARGRRQPVPLEHEDGSRVAKDDHAGRLSALSRLIEAARRDEPAAGDGVTLAKLAAAYIAWLRAEGRKPRSVDAARTNLARLCNHQVRPGAYLHERPAHRVTVDDLADAARALRVAGRSSQTVKHTFAAAKALYRWACKSIPGREPRRYFADHQLRDPEMPTAHNAHRRVLPWAEAAALLDFADAYADAMAGLHGRQAGLKALALRCMAESGARPKELMDLRWEWWRGVGWEVPREGHKTGEKTGRLRLVALTRATAEKVEAARSISAAGHCFRARGDPAGDTSPTAGGFTAWVQDVAGRARAAGIAVPEDFQPYDLRRRFTSDARRAGIDARDESHAAGHGLGVAHRIYDRAELEDAARTVERLAESRRGAG